MIIWSSVENPILPPVPHLEGKDVRANWNATALAFLGDSVWEVCKLHSSLLPLQIAFTKPPLQFNHCQNWAASPVVKENIPLI